MAIISTLLCIYLLLRPYYFFSSGGLQISDFFLVIAFFIFMLLRTNDKKKIKEELTDNKLFVFFVIFTFGINLLYFIIYGKFKFILSSIYYVFNLVAIVTFSFVFKNNEDFMKRFDRIIKFNLIIQFLIYALSLGRYYVGSRYMGTFNNPNQFGYYVLISFAYISLFSNKLKNKKYSQFVFFILSSFFIILSGSTGMFLGLFIMVIFKIINVIKNIPRYLPNVLLAIFFLVPILFIIFSITNIDIEKFENIIIFDRVIEKINKVINYNELEGDSYSQMSIFEERGYDKIYLYPQYILYGAGEGEYERFSKAANNNEIHATLPSILFYYGIIPTLIIIKWIVIKLKNIKKEYLVVYIALIIESFTLLNQRQSLFWILFVVAPLFAECNNIDKKIIKE